MTNNTETLLDIAKETFLASKYNIHRFQGETLSKIVNIDLDQDIIQCRIERSIQNKHINIDMNIKRNDNEHAQLIFGDGQGRGISQMFSVKLLNA